MSSPKKAAKATPKKATPKKATPKKASKEPAVLKADPYVPQESAPQGETTQPDLREILSDEPEAGNVFPNTVEEHRRVRPVGRCGRRDTLVAQEDPMEEPLFGGMSPADGLRISPSALEGLTLLVDPSDAVTIEITRLEGDSRLSIVIR